MSARQLVALGTSSQAPTRYRAHNSYALRWDEQLILFDPGEGTQRGCIFGGVAIARVTAVCITHFHGDHCLGLPGIIQRRALDARSAAGAAQGHSAAGAAQGHSAAEGAEGQAPLAALPVFYPADGDEYLERMRRVSIFHDTSRLEKRPVPPAGLDGVPLGSVRLSARPLDHRVTTFGYRIDEPPARRFDPERLAAFGIRGPDVGRLERDGHLEVNGRQVRLEDVSVVRPGQSMAFVMDTALCDEAVELARGVDLLVCESTFLHAEVALAEEYGHMTALQAGELAAVAGARRLCVTHFSARYPDNRAFADEASRFHPDVVAAEDLAVIDVPTRLP